MFILAEQVDFQSPMAAGSCAFL